MLVLIVGAFSLFAAEPAAPIDREALVSRHNPVIRKVDMDAPLTVGNGGFAFTADITGFQTFAEQYHRWGIPTETLSRWCWVSDPNTNRYTLADASRNFVQADGRTVAYPTRSSTPAGDWLRKNPRIQPLGQLSLEYVKDDGSPLSTDDIQEPAQTLDLWRGVITSTFKIDGKPVRVVTACHPQYDLVAVRITSDLVAAGKLRVRLGFPRGYNLSIKNTPPLDWSHPELHETRIENQTPGWARLSRSVLDARYEVVVAWNGKSEFGQTEPHHFRLAAEQGSRALEFTVGFHPLNEVAPTRVAAATPESQRLPLLHQNGGEGRGEEGSNETSSKRNPSPRSFVAGSGGPGERSSPCSICAEMSRIGVDATLAASAKHWQQFWRSGAAVDFSGSTDPRAAKLEERIILSQYLMAAQEAGKVPPQESGLTCSTWYGKHHTEMIWWHTAHFALWGHDELLAKNLEWFQAYLPEARALAKSRGLRGARWAKMVGPNDRESPGGNPLIIWNQPHLVYLCELLYRNNPTSETLAKYRDLVQETADCLASMVHFDKDQGVYVLGPPLWIAQEIYDQATSQNPSFELAYWQWALETAQHWRERRGLKRDAQWDDIIHHLAPVPQKDGKYVALGSHPDTWDNIDSRHDHPTMLAPLGVLPGTGVERATMGRTLDAVLDQWDWETKIWGWDYPMIAMTATRLDRPETAVEILLRAGPNNIYMPNGHCPQRSDEALPKHPKPGARKREIAVYLPANGAFLSAVAMMVAGWDGCDQQFPGFPKDGKWSIRAEGVKRLP